MVQKPWQVKLPSPTTNQDSSATHLVVLIDCIGHGHVFEFFFLMAVSLKRFYDETVKYILYQPAEYISLITGVIKWELCIKHFCYIPNHDEYFAEMQLFHLGSEVSAVLLFFMEYHSYLIIG